MRVKKILSALLLSIITTTAYSQCSTTDSWDWPGHRNWFTANPTTWEGLITDMSTGTTTSVGINGGSVAAGGAINTYEGISAVSDDNGNLLWYTNGRKIWTGVGAAATLTYSGLLAGNEDGATGDKGSAVQGVMIIKHPLSVDEYYVFTSDDANSGSKNGLNYWIVNSAGIVQSGPTRLGTFVTTEGISVTRHGNGIDLWVGVMETGSGEFNSYLLNCNGVDIAGSNLNQAGAPTVSGQQDRGAVAFSHDGTKFAQAHPNGWPNADQQVSVYDFDNTTGAITNGMHIANSGTIIAPYDLVFSPDDSRLYISRQSALGIYYFDLSSGVKATITASFASTGISTGFSALEIGPNSVLYTTTGTNSSAIRAITPTGGGDLNTATTFSVADLPGTMGNARSGLPIMYIPPTDSPEIQDPGALCDTDAPVDLSTVWDCSGLNAEVSAHTYSGPGITDANLGTFDPALAGIGNHEIIFTLSGACNLVDDTLFITVTSCGCPNIDPNLGANTTICDDATTTLDAGSGLTSYQWKENGVILGSTGSTITADSGTYIVNVTDINGCTGTDTIEIGNYQLPSIGLGPNNSYCSTDSVQLDAGAFTDYLWTPNSESVQQVWAKTIGTYSVTVTDANGCQNTDSVIITESALPVPTITGNTIVCEDSTTLITGVAGSGGTLAWSGITPSTNPLAVTSAGTYTIIETDPNGCIDSVDHVVTFEDLPSVDLGGPYTFCFSQGNELLDAFSGGANETYLWSNASTASTLDVTDSSIVSVIVTSENGCMAYDTAIIDTFSLPKVELGNDAFYCKASSIVLDAGAFDSWVWTPNGETTQKITVTAEGTYGVTVTDENGCENTDQIIITEKELPTIDLGPDTTVCEADSIPLDATHNDAVSYSWTPNSENTPTIKIGSTDGTFGVTITDNNGCVFTASITIKQEDLPIVNLGLNDTICDDLKKTLNAGAGVQQAYTWYLNDAVIENETSQTFAADSGTYIVSVKTPFGCETKDTIEIDNYQLPVIVLTSSHEFCELDSVNLDAGNPTATFNWVPGNKTDQTIWANSDTTYTVTVTDTNGCINEGSSVVSENPKPIPGLGLNSAACIGLETQLDATVPNGVTYIWSTTSTTGIHDKATYSFTGPDTVSVIVTDSKGCIGYDTLEIRSLDSLNIQFGDTALECENDIQALDPGDFQGASYTWTLPNGSTDYNQSIVPNEIGWHVINVIDQFNCKGLDSIYIVIIPLPNINLGPDTVFCSYGQDVYTIRMEFDQKVTGTIDWNDGGDNNNSNDTLFSATYAPSTVIGQFIDDSTGCTHRDSVQLTEFCEPTLCGFPNIFSPGGTSNRYFHQLCVEDSNYVKIANNIVSSEFEVYNRWGLKVFQSENLLPRWNGVYENRPVASGTYFWVYKYKDTSLKEYRMNGFVQVIQMM